MESKELKEAVEFLDEIQRDPEKFKDWTVRVMAGWLTRYRSSSRRSRSSKGS